MINNRQNGRRRGRGGVRPPNGTNGGNDRGSRIDNRSRGNAAQLHEKYKALARDGQMQGDRVLTEYYLQFADHYFRVLSENRSRFDEQNQRRPRDDQFDDFDEGDGDMDAGEEAGEMAPRYAQQQGQRRDRQGYDGQSYDRQGNDRQGNDRQASDRQSNDRQGADPQRGYARESGGADNAGGSGNGAVNGGRPPRREQVNEQRPDLRYEADPGNGRPPRREPSPEPRYDAAPAVSTEASGETAPPRRGRRPRAEPAADAPRIEIDRLPPAFAAPVAPPANDAGEAIEPAPRRRGRPRRIVVDDGSAAGA